MSTQTWNISDLRMPGVKYRSASGTEILSLRVYQGVCLLGINLDKQPKPIFNKHLKANEVFDIALYMTEFAKSEPNTDKTLVFNAYNSIEKKRVMDYVLIFRKDERKVFHIIIKSNGQNYDFPIKGPASMSFGTGDIPEDERSRNEWLYIANFLKTMIPTQMMLSSFPVEYNKGAQGNGNYQRGQGSNNYQRGGQQGGGNYAPRPNSNGEFQSSRGLPSDDDVFE